MSRFPCSSGCGRGIAPAIYVQTGKAETQRDTLETQNAADELVIASCTATAEAAEATLDNLRQLAHSEDAPQLETIISDAEQKADKQEEYNRMIPNSARRL
jgi:tRNA A37 methylthiotransferase MiaB